jgi:hypothetical protein
MAHLAELLAASQTLSDRGLRQSAKWALELHAGASPDSAGAAPVLSPAALAAARAGAGAPEDEGVYQLARLYLDGREFARAAHVLDRRHAPRGSIATPRSYPPRHYFLRCYALFLVRFFIAFSLIFHFFHACARDWLHPLLTPPAPPRAPICAHSTLCSFAGRVAAS